MLNAQRALGRDAQAAGRDRLPAFVADAVGALVELLEGAGDAALDGVEGVGDADRGDPADSLRCLVADALAEADARATLRRLLQLGLIAAKLGEASAQPRLDLGEVERLFIC